MSGNQVESGPGGFFSKVRGKVRAKLQRFYIEESLHPVQESASGVLARTTLPDRQVNLGDISIYRVLPIDFAATRRLAIALNNIKET